jgi:alkaline phosphatase D
VTTSTRGRASTARTNPRGHLPARELFSLEDYRTRHAQYKTDPDLQAAHAAFPWLITWDDHEFKDNYANLAVDDLPPDVVAARRAAAYQAYWEHTPLSRTRKPVAHDLNLYRRMRWGTLATFHVLDTRQYRDDQIPRQCTQVQRDPRRATARASWTLRERSWALSNATGVRGPRRAAA